MLLVIALFALVILIFWLVWSKFLAYQSIRRRQEDLGDLVGVEVESELGGTMVTKRGRWCIGAMREAWRSTSEKEAAVSFEQTGCPTYVYIETAVDTVDRLVELVTRMHANACVRSRANARRSGFSMVLHDSPTTNTFVPSIRAKHGNISTLTSVQVLEGFYGS